MKYLVPSSRPEDWRRFLADPEMHWVRGRSAWEVAHSWEMANGFPEPVQKLLEECDVPVLQGLEIIDAQPELKTPLPGGQRASQTDLWVLAQNSLGSVSIGVEAKVDEPFGELVREWDPDSSPGRRERIDYLCELLGVEVESVLDVRYQLIHRTAAAFIEAKRHDCATGLMLVHSFSPEHAGFDDYSLFVELLGGEAQLEGVSHLGAGRYTAWVTDVPLQGDV